MMSATPKRKKTPSSIWLPKAPPHGFAPPLGVGVGVAPGVAEGLLTL